MRDSYMLGYQNLEHERDNTRRIHRASTSQVSMTADTRVMYVKFPKHLGIALVEKKTSVEPEQ